MSVNRPVLVLSFVLAAVLVCFAAVAAIHFTEAPPDSDTAYEVSTINALMEGAYDGIEPVGELKEHGDFGVGCYDGIDGELILLDGVAYQARSDGRIYRAPDNLTVPWATVTFFKGDFTVRAEQPMNFSTFSSATAGMLPSRNMIYAVKMHGTFPYMKVRSTSPKQKPYPNQTEVLKTQSVFLLNNTTGTVLGFYMPAFYEGINIPGYHLHYITDDRQAGGHILDCTVPGETNIEYDITQGYTMSLPTEGDFTGMDLTRNLSSEISVVMHQT